MPRDVAHSVNNDDDYDHRLVILPPQVRASTGAAATFGEHLAREIPSTGVLTYSSRLSLLRHAQKLGVRRFEANLLIAAVLERRRQSVGAPPEADALPQARSLASTVLAFILVQGVIVLGTWWTLFR